MPDPSIPTNRVYWCNNGVAANALTSSDGVSYLQYSGHCEFRVVTGAGFAGSFAIYGVPTNADADSSSVAIYVDGVFNQTVGFNVGANLDKLQTIVVDVGVTGVHTIRIQEGDRYAGVCLTKISIDGALLPTPAIARRYTAVADSVGQGCLSTPRTNGWVERMREASRFDCVQIFGQSGYSLNDALSPGYNAAAATALAVRIMTNNAAYTGSTENVFALCLSINDWYQMSLSAATFSTRLALLVDALKAMADAQGTPGFKLMLHSMTHVTTAVNVANPAGSTPADFNTAISVIAAARPAYCTYLDLFSACLDADMVDSLHPSAVGHGKIYAVVLAAT